jgi:FlaA1/EpsC-like NDP-sugar epimerase
MPVILRTIQILTDLVLILASFTLAYFLRVGFIFSSDFPFSLYATVFIPTSLAWLIVLVFQNIYASEPISKRRLFTNIITSNLIGITVFVLIFFYKRDIFFSRLILIYVWGISNLLLISSSWLFRILRSKIYRRGIGTKKVLVVGTNKIAVEAIQDFQENEPYFQAVAILDAYGASQKEILGVPVLGKMNSLEDVVKEKNIKVIVQADCIEQSMNLVDFAEKNELDYFLMPSLLGNYHHNITATLIGKKAVITVR